MPPGMTHEQRMALMKQQGQMAMGFDQDKATHHFTLTANGGAIQVTAMDPADQVTRDEIQKHLQEIAAAFGRGDFAKRATPLAGLVDRWEIMIDIIGLGAGVYDRCKELHLPVRGHPARA
jgi:hypothetical protein